MSDRNFSSVRWYHFGQVLLLALLVALGIPSLASAAAPRFQIEASTEPTNLRPNDPESGDVYRITVLNVGNASSNSSSPLIVTDALPAGVSATRVDFYMAATGLDFEGANRGTAIGAGSLCTMSPVSCTYPGGSGLPPIESGGQLVMVVHVEVHRKPGTVTSKVTVAGGGAPEAVASFADQVGETPAPFGLQRPELNNRNADGSLSTQAGSHPDAITTVVPINDELWQLELPGPPFRKGIFVATEDLRNAVTELPAGFVGNPQVIPTCSLATFQNGYCPPDTQIGVGFVRFNGEVIEPGVYNLQPSKGQVAAIGVAGLFGPKVILIPTLRTGGDYGLRVTSLGTPATLAITYIRLTIWGTPADPSHDLWRGRTCGNLGCYEGGIPSDAQPPAPYLTNPTACNGEALPASLQVDSWEHSENFLTYPLPWSPIDGCNQLSFEPTIEAHPTTNVADAPSGLRFDLRMPLKGLEEPEADAEANLEDAVVRLPRGLAVNPASANGQGACSPAQIGLTSQPGESPATYNEAAAECPTAAKLGTVRIDTPLLAKPLPGSIYLAEPRQNPFGSLLAIYLAVDDPQTGVVIKLAGRITPDPETGQLTTHFEDSPQQPFEDFHLEFFGGALGALRTPATCGAYQTTSVLTPWSAPASGPPAEPTSGFEITTGAGGGACPGTAAAQPNAPLFRAGTESPQAGAFSPFSFRLAREDGSQEIEKIETTLPPGLVGRLAGVGECSDAQIAAAQAREHEGGGGEEATHPSCPEASEVGSVEIASGAGPAPLNVTGHAYLAGPYKGAPLSLAIVTPATAGPFDLGAVVVRTALYLDPYSAQIKAVSDPIPHILQGIPLDVRSITLKMNRPGFTLNPTNCNPLAFGGSEASVLGQVAPLSQRFQVGGCQPLAFKPKLSLKLMGATRRSGFPALTAKLTMPPGGANIAGAQVTLPHSAFLEQAHITASVCTQPELASRTCPPASVYGYAKAVTPLLDQPLEGPVYLGVGFGHTLPDLVAELNGQIRVLLHGKVDTGREDGIRNTFEVVPDAPVSSFTLHLFGGKRGLIANHENLCSAKTKRKALARFTAQNGKVAVLEPTIKNSCKKGGKRHHRRSRSR